MIVLILIAAVLAVATVWFLARAVRAAPVSPVQEQHEGFEQLRDRLLAQLRELDVEEGDRNVDTGVAADERRRLEAELAQVLRHLEGSAQAPAPAASESSARLWGATVFVLALILPLVSASLYLVKNSGALAQLSLAQLSESRTPVVARETTPPPMVQEMVARLEQRLKEQPNDPQGWARLGRSYEVLGRAGEARQAYARAYQTAPDNPQIVAAYARFLMSGDPSHLSAETVALFRKLHTLEPRHPGALWALGFAAYQDQKFGQAIKYWEQLLKQLPPDSEVVPELKHALDIARAESVKSQK